MQPKSILIIEDEVKIAELIELYLTKEGYRVLKAENGREGLALALELKPALLILDRMLPEMEGLEVLRKLRAKCEIPVLILSAQSDEMDKILGLEMGADDYLSKPFSPKELVARVKAILRRPASAEVSHAVIELKGLVLDPLKMSLRVDGVKVELSVLEFKLLHTLMKEPGRVFSREQLMAELYHSQAVVFDRTIDAHVKNLRKKLKDDPKHPRFIQSVFGAGYTFLDS